MQAPTGRRKVEPLTAPVPNVGSQRSVTTVEAVPPVGSLPRAVLAFVALIVATGFAAGAALSYSKWLYVGSVVAVCLIEIFIDRYTPFISWGLGRVGAGAVARGLLMGATLVVFAVQTNGPPMVIAAMAAVLIALAASMARSAAAQAIYYLRRPPLMTRGVELGIAPAPLALPYRILRQHGAERLADVPAAVGLALAGGKTGHDVFGYIGLALYVIASLAVPWIVVGHTVRVRRLQLRRRVTAAAERALTALDPRIVLYFGDGPAWQYQVEVWLRALEATGHPVLIVVRDRDVLQTLPPTTLPIACVPASRELMQLPLPSLRAALFVGNNSSNLHMLRRPGVTSVFLGHGDSDKDASRNPFTRAYNEIWVAGPAGRERYRLAGVGVSEHAFREIGRPQLTALNRQPDAAFGNEALLTVLYAPTWEGWGESPNHSSLADSGVALVRELLTRPGVRVMYRPHPRTGHLRPEMRAAHRQIVALLEAAGATVAQPAPPTVEQVRADALDTCLRDPVPVAPAAEQAASDAQYWREHPGHRILTGPGPDLYAAFRVADALIADVSSVVTDFLAADRVYAIVNNTSLDESSFRLGAPAAAGGYVIERDLTGLDALLDAAGDPRLDDTAAPRVRARDYLLGPPGAESQLRFRHELDRLAGRERPVPPVAESVETPAATP